MRDIETLVGLMISMGVAKASDLVGVPLKQIQTLEHQLNRKFPRIYKDFLLRFGRSAGYLSPWMAIYFDDLKEIQETYEVMIDESGSSFQLPDSALLIANLDSVFDFILCAGKENPPVFRIDLNPDRDVRVVQYAPSFSDYLENTIRHAETDAIPKEVFDEQLGIALDHLMN